MDSPTTQTGHIFISYERNDQAYTRKLRDSLRQRGFDVWVDERIDSGDRWLRTIERAVRDSAAVVVVMTPEARDSEWVEAEILLAQDEGKPIFPLLLRGKVFFSLVTKQYTNVTDGQMPPDDFYERLEREVRVPSAEEISAPSAPEPAIVRTGRAWSWQHLRLPLELAGLLAIVLLVGVVVVGLIGRGDDPTPISTASVPAVAAQPTPTHSPRPPIATFTSASVVADRPISQRPTPTPASNTGSTTLREKDGMEMLYVPGGTFEMGSMDGASDEQPVHSVTLDSFWIDRTEVTNAQYARCVEAGACSPPSESGSFTRASYYGDSQFDDYPVIYMSWYDADTYCQWAGGRLPTEAEWEYAARGPDSLVYPWGNDLPQESLLNYAYNVGDTLQAGSYPDGASWVGALDMAGNVWEWVQSEYQPYPYQVDYRENMDSTNSRVMRGGSWGPSGQDIRAANRSYGGQPDARENDFGFRCVLAPTLLPTPGAVAASTPTATSVPPTDTPVSPTDTPTPNPSIPSSDASLHDTWTRPADDMEMVYVPGGTFQMGGKYDYDDERPVHAVTLDGFWIDRTEVTNSQYVRCVANGICDPPSKSVSKTRDSYYGEGQFEDYPVVYVSWYDANTYCRWAGGRLSTEAEWEYAARGPDSFIYPWGNDPPDDTLANYGYNIGDTTQVGSYPGGASWVGALDMAGNVAEWVQSEYQPYPYQMDDGRENLDSANARVLRGVGWDDPGLYVRAADRDRLKPGIHSSDIGFRCVVEPGN